MYIIAVRNRLWGCELAMDTSENQQGVLEWLRLLIVEIPFSLFALLVIVGSSFPASFLFMTQAFAWGVISMLAYIPFAASGAATAALPKLHRKRIVAIGSFALGIIIVIIGVWTGALQYSIAGVEFGLIDFFRLVSSDFGVGVMAGMSVKVLLHLWDLRGKRSVDPDSHHTQVLNANIYVVGFLLCAGVLVIASNLFGLGDTPSGLGLLAIFIAELFVALIFSLLDFL